MQDKARLLQQIHEQESLLISNATAMAKHEATIAALENHQSKLSSDLALQGRMFEETDEALQKKCAVLAECELSLVDAREDLDRLKQMQGDSQLMLEERAVLLTEAENSLATVQRDHLALREELGQRDLATAKILGARILYTFLIGQQQYTLNLPNRTAAPETGRAGSTYFNSIPLVLPNQE